MLRDILDIIFPQSCINCGGESCVEKVICKKCLDEIVVNKNLFCGECSARLPEGKKICHRECPYILGAAGNYQDEALRKLILNFKFRGVKEAGVILSRLITDYAKQINWSWGENLVVPIPLASRREKERGFNQAQVIAEAFAKKMSLETEINNLIRTKNTKPQNEISDYEIRASNIRGAFLVKRSERFDKKTVVLVDDVTTSGSTLYEAACALKESGVKKVLALTVAKA